VNQDSLELMAIESGYTWRI